MRHQHRAGSVLVYAFLVMVALSAIVALAVDWGRMQVTKSELRSAADAAARYGVAGLQNDLDGVSAAYANATKSVEQNRANGRPITFVPAADVQIGKWTVATRTFEATSNLNQANAVKVTLRCSEARGSAVPLTFMPVVGRRNADVTATSIAMIDYTGNAGAAGNGRYEYFIPATSNPWLSGMPKGSVASRNNPHNNEDYAGKPLSDAGQTKTYARGTGFSTGGSTNAGSAETNYAAWGDYAGKKASPIQAGGISINGGVPMTFDGINGGATNAAGQSTDDADGAAIVTNSAGSENGIANIKAPINSVIGVFLSDTKPTGLAGDDEDDDGNTLASGPPTLDFSTASKRDFASLNPKLAQPFFIGDGRTGTGEVQQFVPPAGATRLFICTMDAYEWSNNVGGFYVTAHLKGRIITVSEKR